MLWILLIALIAVVGWLVNHQLTLRRKVAELQRGTGIGEPDQFDLAIPKDDSEKRH